MSLAAIACGIAPLTAAPLVAVSGGAALAEIIPDNSLGAERSLVTPDVEIKNQLGDRIDGGAIRGANLFHSFQEFSIREGQRVYFANPAGIERILTRVTGGKISEIFGTLGVDGIADLFLINPAGIIFGKTASLDVGGSFIASTADSVIFPDGIEFSATNPQTPPLLVMNVPEGLQFGANPDAIAKVPEGLQFGANPGAIAVEGTGHNITAPDQKFNTSQRAQGLKVPDGKTLALVGGNLTLTGGNVTALGGRVELGSVAGASQVSLIPTEKGFSLNYSGVQNFGEIQLYREASADVSGAGGNIQVQGSRVTLTEGSVLLALTEGEDSAGTLAVNASDTVELIGTSQGGSFSSGLFTETTGNGAAGDLSIFTRRLVMQNGAQASSSTFGDGRGGNLDVTATESVELIGSSIAAATLGNGAPGNITINTGHLTAKSQSYIFTSVTELNSGTNPTTGGNLTVNTPPNGLVKLTENSSLSADTYGALDSGELTVATGRLIARDGSQVNVSSFETATGNAGNLSVRAADSIELSGRGQSPSGSGLFAETQGSGNAGDLKIETNRLTVRDGATISVRGLASGAAGNLEIQAGDRIRLKNSGTLDATTAAGNRGNITLRSRNIFLTDNSNITTNATGDAVGGNIDIQATNWLAAVKNSDITANAFKNEVAGRINITAGRIFGLETRTGQEIRTLLGTDIPEELNPNQLPSSDITAFSQTNPAQTSGQIIRNTPNSTIPEVSAESKKAPVNPDTRIALGCEANEGQNSSWFINTNRGGLPANPGDPLNSLAVWDDVRSLNQGAPNRSMSAKVPSPNSPASPAPPEAQGWVWKEGSNKTAVRLTANTRAVAPYRSWQKPAGCDGK